MKTFKFYGVLLASALIAFASCSKEEATVGSSNAPEPTITKAFTVNGGTVQAGSMPAANANDPGITVNSNNSALAGGGNIITISSPISLTKAFLEVANLEGFIECPLTTATRATSTADMYEYVVEVMYNPELAASLTVKMNVEAADGSVINVMEKAIEYVESQKGDLAVNLVFDQPKDVDLWLVMPDGTDIYYGNRMYSAGGGNQITDEQWEAFEKAAEEKAIEIARKYGIDMDEEPNESNYELYAQAMQEFEEWYERNHPNRGGEYGVSGLDHDSNAGCSIDNLNNENIVFKGADLVPGTYTVLVNMYSNCDSREGTETNFTVMTRIGDQYVIAESGSNPFTGKFAHDAYSNSSDIKEYMTKAMTFTLTETQIAAMQSTRAAKNVSKFLVRKPLDDMSIMKLMDGGNFGKLFGKPVIRRIK